jgi:hypothetical protein
VPGAAGGGSWDPVTVPEGAGVSGAGCESSEENRELEQPAAVSAISDTTTRLVFEKFIKSSVGACRLSGRRYHRTQIGDVGEIATGYG